MKALPISILLASLAFVPTAQAVEYLSESIATDYEENLAEQFVYFHEHPELSNLESNTAKILADKMREMGYEVTEGVGGTGVVAVMKNGPGPVIMIRADMDGLPIKEESGLAYASTAVQTDESGVERPVMHACGHDVHITALLGTAKQMAQRSDDWSGTLVLIGQPAEERISGARAMLEDGLYERFPKPDYALAFHVSAGGPAGKVSVPQAIYASSSDSVDIIVHGIGTHGASPQQGLDPVLIASQIVVSLQSIVSRSIAPLSPGVITVGSIHGGNKHNIISDKVELQLTVRSNDPDVRTALLDGIDRVARGVAISMGVPEDKMPEVIRSKVETTPPTINDTPTAAIVLAAITEQMGEEAMYSLPKEGMGAEDFAYFVQPETGVKGVYFSVGGTPESELGSEPSHHSAFFKVQPEPSIKSGIEASVISALTLFNQ